jgi:class 3 adenylate cyclase
MSSIIYFDIRNFSTHVSYLSLNNKSSIIFDLIENIFKSLEKAIKRSRTYLGISGQTFINHTGDGFLAIFYGKGKSLQSIYVASSLSNDVQELLKKYDESARRETNQQLLPSLDYGIGIHLGDVKKFKYHPKYPENHRILGFFGNAINISYRVQESTKDHMFHIICTKRLYGDAIKVIKDEHKDTIKKYFTKLDKHKLPGMTGPYTLYGVSIDFAMKIKPYMISNWRKK